MKGTDETLDPQKTPLDTTASTHAPAGNIPKWLTGLYFIVGFYILFVCFSLYTIGDSTTQLYDYPYTVARKTEEMRTELYNARRSLPLLLGSTNISPADINSFLKDQISRQTAALERISQKFRGNDAELDNLKQALEQLWSSRQEMVSTLAGTHDLPYINSYYRREVLPYFEKVDELLLGMSEAAQQRGRAILKEMTNLRNSSIIATLLIGLGIIFLIIYTTRLERNRAKESAYRERILNLVADNINEVFLIIRPDITCEYASSNTERTLGVPFKEFLNNPRKIHTILEEQDSAWLKEVFDYTSPDFQERNVVLKNSDRHFKIRVYPIFEDDVLKQRIVTLSDQTADVQQRQALRDALENARNASMAKSNFLSHMSHEIRTPMNAIIGMTTIAMTRLDDRSRIEDCLSKIALSSRHLLGIINDVLDMSKIEGGKLTIAHEAFNFQTAMEGVVNLILPQAQARGLDFEVVSTVEEEELMGDALRVNQILINILSNSIKFTPAGGSVRLEVRQLYKKNNTVQFRFVIRDTGIGMSEEFLKKLYTPFEQATSSTASKFGGTGLGMAITKNLISLLGGTIFVKSKEGEGSEFTVELPFGLSGRKPEAYGGRLAPLKVLIVDDDHGTCEHASLLLEKMGLRCRWVLSGADAIKLVQESHANGDDYDVCFIDWKMPDMDGMETATRIRQTVGDETCIIIISAYNWESIQDQATSVGVNGFIPKPFFASNLYNALNTLTRKTTTAAEKEKAAPQEAATDDDERHYDFTGKHILLVEDNEFNREIANEFLEMTGATVDNAEDGSQGVSRFTESEPGTYDIILMDVQMPVMDGHEATRTIRASSHPDAKSIPILAMTANAFSEDVSTALAAGMNGHIAKPIDIKELYRTLALHFKS
ncbi:MAG: response regulator [Desulfovibrionaceae bacterium]|nr:response regulator [Desulfovibrionaceae bacterium]